VKDVHREGRHAYREDKHTRKRSLPYKLARRMSVFCRHM
jgi:hypothetical protein